MCLSEKRYQKSYTPMAWLSKSWDNFCVSYPGKAKQRPKNKTLFLGHLKSTF